MLDEGAWTVDQEYWLHLDDAHKNNAYSTYDHRHNFRPGVVMSVEAGGFWVQPALGGGGKRRHSVLRRLSITPLETTPSTPNQVTPFAIAPPLSYAPVWIRTTAHENAENLLKIGQSRFRLVEWGNIAPDFFTSYGAEYNKTMRSLTAAERIEKEQATYDLGRSLHWSELKCDFFVSHRQVNSYGFSYGVV
jgi:hypothetical protein